MREESEDEGLLTLTPDSEPAGSPVSISTPRNPPCWIDGSKRALASRAAAAAHYAGNLQSRGRMTSSEEEGSAYWYLTRMEQTVILTDAVARMGDGL